MKTLMEDSFKEIKAAFFEYLRVYFEERNLEKTKQLFSTRFSVFGTGFSEIGFGPAQAIPLFERDITEVPSPVKYEILSLHIQQPVETVGIVSCIINLTFQILKETVSFKNLRYSLVWVKEGNRWYLEYKHLSFPTTAHGEDEAYPVKEIEERNKVLERLVAEKTEELRRANEELNRLAIIDRLTGLYNRFKLEEVLRIEYERAERYGRIFSIILFDIDHFKKVNDTFGHPVGDQLLQQFAKIVSKGVRNTDFCGRWGGEEFLVICPETPAQGARILAENLRTTIESLQFDQVKHKTASFGVTNYHPRESLEELLRRVDQALYKAKRQGRNRVVVME
ncbi:MAG: diguanylate cyclase [Treponemataceae bacterium]|nr:diguanylate cyclase [Treponemataceae bacterium]